MSRGLDQMLETIRKRPEKTLIHRYLALLAEIADERQKVERTLDLAEAVCTVRPREALRLARMVYRAEPDSLRSIDVMVAAFRKLGRPGKAEVLRLEKEKRISRAAARTMEDRDDGNDRDPVLSLADGDGDEDAEDEEQAAPAGSRYAGALVPGPAPEGGAGSAEVRKTVRSVSPASDEYTSFAELDLGAVDEAQPGGVQGQARPEDLLFPPDADMSRINPDIKLENEKAVRFAAEHFASVRAKPVDTVFPFSGAIDKLRRLTRKSQAVEPLSPAEQSAGSNAPTVNLYEHIVEKPLLRPLAHPPEVAGPDLVPAAEMFDHFWRSGHLADARKVLEQTAFMFGNEPWWQARNLLMRKAVNRSGSVPGETGPLVSGAPEMDQLAGAEARKGGPVGGGEQADVSAPTARPFWEVISAELGRLAAGLGRELAPVTVVQQMQVLLQANASGIRLDEGLVRALIEVPHSGTGGGQVQNVLAQKWELLSGLFSSTPVPEGAAVLERLGLQAASPGFFGLYLDCLLVGQKNPRRAMSAVRIVLSDQPVLAMAQVVQRRLSAIYRSMGAVPEHWEPEEGVPALLQKLNKRPTLRTASLVALELPWSSDGASADEHQGADHQDNRHERTPFTA